MAPCAVGAFAGPFFRWGNGLEPGAAPPPPGPRKGSREGLGCPRPPGLRIQERKGSREEGGQDVSGHEGSEDHGQHREDSAPQEKQTQQRAPAHALPCPRPPHATPDEMVRGSETQWPGSALYPPPFPCECGTGPFPGQEHRQPPRGIPGPNRAWQDRGTPSPVGNKSVPAPTERPRETPGGGSGGPAWQPGQVLPPALRPSSSIPGGSASRPPGALVPGKLAGGEGGRAGGRWQVPRMVDGREITLWETQSWSFVGRGRWVRGTGEPTAWLSDRGRVT